MNRCLRLPTSTLPPQPSRLGCARAHCAETRTRTPSQARSFISTNSPSSSFLADLFKANVTGTVPFHTSYVLLQHPDPPKLYPAKLDKAFSPLGRTLTVATAQRRGVTNFWYSQPREEKAGSNKDGKKVEERERYPMLMFGTDGLGRNVMLEGRQEASSDAYFIQELESTLSTPTRAQRRIQLTEGKDEKEEYDVLLLVCTHGARDCHCGDTGGELVRVLRKEVEGRSRAAGSPRVKVGEVAHIGGHKYFACSIVFPFGDWLGNLRPSDGPRILDHIDEHYALYQKQLEAEESAGRAQALPPLIPDKMHWRGRMGLTKEEQIDLMSAHARD